MKYRDLREFIAGLEADGKLKRIQHPVSPHLEMTEIADRVLRAEGPALLFEHPIKPDGTRYDYPVLANLFGTPERVAMGMGADFGSLRAGRRADVVLWDGDPLELSSQPVADDYAPEPAGSLRLPAECGSQAQR